MENASTPACPAASRVEVLRPARPTTDRLAAVFGLDATKLFHARRVTRELAMALHWHRFFQPTPANQHRVAAHALEAGRRAYWAHVPYVAWLLLCPEAAAVESIWTSFRDGWFAQFDLESIDTSAESTIGSAS